MARLATLVRCVAPVEAVLGEGPLFDPRIGRLLFVDIKGERLFRYDPQTEKTERFSAPGTISALALRRRGGYVCARKEGFAFLDIDGDALAITPIASPEADRPGNRFNDGKADPFGGFWAGSMDAREKNTTAGSWWRLAPGAPPERIDTGFHVTNGPAFDAARGRVYFTDSARQTIYVARATSDGFAEKTTFLTFGKGDGYPDGMEVDCEGGLWVAFWDGGAIRRFSTSGALLEEVKIPAPRPTSIALVGDRAFVTSARVGLSAETLEEFPHSGGLFEIALAGACAAAHAWFEG